MKLSSFFKQCSEKEVFKMLSIYIVSAWVALQVLSITWQPLGLPQRSVTYLIILLLLCFPVYMFFLWKLRLAPAEKSETEPDENDEKQRTTFQKMYFSSLGIIATMCFIAVFLIINKNFSHTKSLPEILSSDKVAVLKFGNNTGDPKYDIVSKMASDWIIHGITENQVAQVITQDLIDEYRSLLKGKNIEENEITVVKEYLRPSKIISGNFYLMKGKLIFQGMLIDGKTNKTIISFKPTECAAENPLQCIDDLNESITGYFITKDKKNLMLQENPPKFKAYKYVLEAKYSNNNQDYINLLDKAIAEDSTYFEPKVLRVAHYYDQKEFKKADSLLKLIKPDSYTNKRQLNLLKMHEALLKGDNNAIYTTFLKEYEIAPFDLISNKTTMVTALQFVNRPEDVETIYNTINMDSMSLQNCPYCIQRIYVKAFADIELGNYMDAIQIIEKAQRKDEASLLNKPLVIAFVREGKKEALQQFLQKIELTETPANTQKLYLQVGKEFLLKSDSINAKNYLSKIYNSEKVTPKLKAEALFFAEEYAEAAKILKDFILKNPQNIDATAKLAICQYKLGNETEANKNILALESLRADYQYGSVDYALAEYYAAKGDTLNFNKHILKAAAGGHLYVSQSFQNDPQFLKYRTSKEFEEALTFWK